MSDAVAVTGSSEIDYAVIDGSYIGAVIIQLTEGSAAADTLPSKHKTATPIKIEVQKQLDTFSKFKVATPTFSELCGNLDTLLKHKVSTKILLERVQIVDWAEWIYNIITGHNKIYDYPAVQVTNESR